jgi:hypothetical protein
VCAGGGHWGCGDRSLRDGDGDGPSRIPYGGRGDGDVVFGAGSGSGLWFDMKLEIVSG